MRNFQSRKVVSAPNKEEDNSLWSTVIWVCFIVLALVVVLYLTVGSSNNKNETVTISLAEVSSLHREARQINVNVNFVSYNGNKIYYRETKPDFGNVDFQDKNPKNVEILFLHGYKYSSSTWQGTGTLQILANRGFRCVAIDLPNFGLSRPIVSAKKKKTKKTTKITKKKYGKIDIDYKSEKDVITFLYTIVNELRMKNIVIVCPSFSGYYGIPVLLRDNEIDLRGFAAIAPARIDKYASSNIYMKVETPVLIMKGEKDNTEYAKNAEKWLTLIPGSQYVVIDNSEHPAFIGNPKQFHGELLHWLTTTVEDETFDNPKREENLGFFDDWSQTDWANYIGSDYDYGDDDYDNEEYDDYDENDGYVEYDDDYDDENFWDDFSIEDYGGEDFIGFEHEENLDDDYLWDDDLDFEYDDEYDDV